MSNSTERYITQIDFNTFYLLWDEALAMHRDGYFLTVYDDDSDNGGSGGDDDRIMMTCHLMVSHPSENKQSLIF